MNFIRAHQRTIIVTTFLMGVISIFAVVLNAPVGLLFLSSLGFGSAALVSFVSQVDYGRHHAEPRFLAYSLGILLILLGFCGPIYFLTLIFLLSRGS